MCQVPCLPTEGSLQNGDKCRKAICKKCIMPIKTSPGQLTPFRRGGYRLYFFLSQRRQDAKKSNRSLPTYRNHGCESSWYFVLGTSYFLNIECPTLSEEVRIGGNWSLKVSWPAVGRQATKKKSPSQSSSFSIASSGASKAVAGRPSSL